MILGGTGRDLIYGGAGADEIHGGDDADTVFGLGGDDQIFGDGGDDTISAGAGNDTVYGGSGRDVIRGDDGDDLLYGEADADQLFGGAGNDRLEGAAGDDLLVGDDGDDVLVGSSGNDTLRGGAGSDLLWGGDALLADSAFLPANLTTPPNASEWFFADVPGFETPAIVPVAVLGLSLDGSSSDGRDRLAGDAGDDWLFGGGDVDDLSGGTGRDYVDGGLGDDSVQGDGGADVVRGGLGSDVVRGGEGIDQLYGDEGDDFLAGDAGDATTGSQQGQRLFGGAGADRLYAFAEAAPAGPSVVGDELHGGADNDTLYGNLRADALFGDGGNDSLLGDILAGPDYTTNPSAATTGGDDWLFGGAGFDDLLGGGGDDQLWGGADSDALEGQDGHDQLFGGSGIDILRADVSASYSVLGDELDGHGGNASAGDVADDNATDILLVEGTDAADTITLQRHPTDAKQLRLSYEDQGGERIVDLRWRDASGPLVEQFRISGLGGDDTIAFGTGADALDVSDLSARSDEFVAVFDGGPGDDVLTGSGARDRLDGGSGNDTLSGFGGDDRLWGGDGDDTLFAGQGNDDLIGGEGDNTLSAWSRDPGQGQLFGLFVDQNGALVDDSQKSVDLGPIEGLARIEGLSIEAPGVQQDELRFTLTNAGVSGDGIEVENLAPEAGALVVELLDAGDNVLATVTLDGATPVATLSLAGRPGGGAVYKIRASAPGAPGATGPIAYELRPDIGPVGTGVVNLFYPLEDTGLNRLLGGSGDDTLFGGTGLDFLYGNGGDDRLVRADGTDFESLDGGLGGDAWKDYARSTGQVWYVGGSNVDDQIQVNFVTEPGLLEGRHLVTRLTNNDGNFTFAAELSLDFDAVDPSGKPVWDVEDAVLDLSGLDGLSLAERSDAVATLDLQRIDLLKKILPPEGEFLAIVIDALGGNDSIVVGPTVQKTVWVDAGAGDDFVDIQAGNAILVDNSERRSDYGRNDLFETAFPLVGIVRVTGGVDLPADGRLAADARFSLRVDGGDARPVVVPYAATAGNATPAALVVDVNDALRTAGLRDRVVASLVDGRLVLSLATAKAGGVLEVSDVDAISRLALGFQVGMTATPPYAAPRLSASVDAPADGRLSGDAFFSLSVDGQTAVAVSLTQADTATNASVADLAADLQLALAAAGLGGVTASADGNRLVLRGGSATPDGALLVTAASGTAAAELGFHQGKQALALTALTDSTLLRGLTIDNPNDVDWYRFALVDAPQPGSRIDLQSAVVTDGLRLELFQDVNGSPVAIPGGVSAPSGDEVRPDLAEALVGEAAAPADGVLAADVTFTLGVGVGVGSSQTLVTVAADAGNRSLDDLVADVNAALERVGIGGSVVANRLGDHLALRALGSLAGADLVYGGSATGLVDGLGFRDGQASDTEASAYLLDPVADLGRVTGLSLDAPGDEDWLRFTVDAVPAEVAGLASVPTDGRLATDASFELVLGAGAPVAIGITSAETAANRDAADLADLLAAKIAASPLAGSVSVALRDGVLVLSSEDPSGVASLEIRNADEAALAELGFRDTLVTPGVVGSVGLEQLDLAGGLSLELVDATGTVVSSATVAAGSQRVQLSLAGLSGGEYRLHVHGHTGGESARYDLLFSIGHRGGNGGEMGGVTGARQLDLGGAAADGIALDGLGLESGVSYWLRVTSPNVVPTSYSLTFDLATGRAPVELDLGARSDLVRRDVILGGTGDDVLSGGPGEDWIFGGPGNDVLTGGLDHQASDLLFGGDGDDTFQLVPDALPTVKGTEQTLVPTASDQIDGGAGDDRVLFLGGNLDRRGVPVPDDVAIRYNPVLQRYELTALRWDIANQDFLRASDGTFQQDYVFFQSRDVERAVFDTGAGDDEVHADPGYTFPGQQSEWGLGPDVRPQHGAFQSVEIHGGDGADRLYGGAGDDQIFGDAGDDYLVGGVGDDRLDGGSGADVLLGGTAGTRDAYEIVTRGGISARNDGPDFAADLGFVETGDVVSGLSLEDGDGGDWFLFETPQALAALGPEDRALVLSQMIDVRFDSLASQRLFEDARASGSTSPNAGALAGFGVQIFAAEVQTDANDQILAVTPFEDTGDVPSHYLLHVRNPNTLRIVGTHPLTLDGPDAASYLDVYLDGNHATQVAVDNVTDATPADFVVSLRGRLSSDPDLSGRIDVDLDTSGRLVFTLIEGGSLELRVTTASGSPENFLETGAGIRDGATTGDPPAGLGTYRVTFADALGFGAIVDVAPDAGSFGVDVNDPLALPVSIPLGDIDGDGAEDFVVAVRNELGTVEDIFQAFLDGIDVADEIGPSIAWIRLSGAASGDEQLGAGDVQLVIPAPLFAESIGLSRATFAPPADYDGDGLADVAVVVDALSAGVSTPPDAAGVYVLYGSSTAWTGTVDLVADADLVIEGVGRGALHADLAAGDMAGLVNGANPMDDLVVSDPATGSVRVFENLPALGAAATLSQATRTYTLSDDQVEDVAVVGDFDGDGRPDLAVSGGDPAGVGTPGAVRIVYAGTPSGSIDGGATVLRLDAESHPDASFPGRGLRVADASRLLGQTGDFDGDGKADLLVSRVEKDSPDGINVLSTPGWGAIVYGRDDGAGSPLTGTFTLVQATATGVAPVLGDTTFLDEPLRFAWLGDVNGDGLQDAIAAGFEQSDSLAERSPSDFSGPRLSGPQREVAKLFLGDAAGPDGAEAGIRDVVFELEGAAFGRDLLLAVDERPPVVALGDVDGGGANDLGVVGGGIGEVRVLLGESSPAGGLTGYPFGPSTPEAPPTPLPAERFVYGFATPTQSTSAAVPGLDLGAQGVGNAADAERLLGSSPSGALSDALDVGDVNGDGISDLVVRDLDHAYLLLGPVSLDGAERADARAEVRVDFVASYGQGMADRMGDLDGDGLTDLVFFDDAFGYPSLEKLWVLRGGQDLPHSVSIDPIAPDPRFDSFDLGSFNVLDASATVLAIEWDGTPGAEVLVWDHTDAFGTVFDLDFATGTATEIVRITDDVTSQSAISALIPNFDSIDGENNHVVTVAGDVDGDGREDLLIGNRTFAVPSLPSLQPTPALGRAYLVPGGFVTYPNVHDVSLDAVPGVVIFQDFGLGASVAGLGDLNVDGYDDIAIGRWLEDFATPGSPYSTFFDSAPSLSIYYGRSGLLGASIRESGGVFTDRTDFTAGASPGEPLFTSGGAGAVGTRQYFGSADPFTQLDFENVTPGVGAYTLGWEYWNGTTWAPLAVSLDSNNSTDGSNLKVTDEPVDWQMPGDWAPTSVDGRGGLYYVRATITGATATVVPRADRVTTGLAMPGAVTPDSGALTRAQDLGVRRLSPGALPDPFFLEGALGVTAGDFDGDGRADLVVGETSRTLILPSSLGLNGGVLGGPLDQILSRDTRGQVVLFRDVVGGPALLSFADADLTLQGAASDEGFGVLAPLPSSDLDGDGIADLLVGAPGADLIGNPVAVDAGRVYWISGARVADPSFDPDALPGVVELVNRTVTGGGDFLVDPGTGQPVVFRATDPADDRYTFASGELDRWYHFTTLGDGLPGNAILVGPARDPGAPEETIGPESISLPATTVRNRWETSIDPSSVPPVASYSDGRSLPVGAGTVVYELDLSLLLPWIHRPDLISATFSGATFEQVAGGSASEFVFTILADDESAVPGAAEAQAPGVVVTPGQDISDLVGEWIAAGRTRMLIRVEAPVSNPNLTALVHDLELQVAAASLPGFEAELVDAEGHVVSPRGAVLDLRDVRAGEYLLHVFRAGDDAPALPRELQIEIAAPRAGQFHTPSDRDVLRGGESADLLIGGAGVDRIFGGTAADFVRGEDFELHDAEVIDTRADPAPRDAAWIGPRSRDLALQVDEGGGTTGPALDAVTTVDVAHALGIPTTIRFDGLEVAARPILASDLARLTRLQLGPADYTATGAVSELSGLAYATNLRSLVVLGGGAYSVAFLNPALDLQGIPGAPTGAPHLELLAIDGAASPEMDSVRALDALRYLSADDTSGFSLSFLRGDASLRWLDLSGAFVAFVQPTDLDALAASVDSGALAYVDLAGTGVSDLDVLVGARVIDDREAGYYEAGPGWAGNDHPYAYDRDYRLNPGLGDAVAVYEFTDLAPGAYSIDLAWPEAEGRSDQVVYTVSGGTEIEGGFDFFPAPDTVVGPATGSVPNPFLGDGRATPDILGLSGGDAPFGLLGEDARQLFLAEVLNRAPAGSSGVVVRTSVLPAPFGQRSDGYDAILFANLGDTAIQDPALGVDGVRVALRDATGNPISQLGAGEIFVVLVPEDALQVSASYVDASDGLRIDSARLEAGELFYVGTEATQVVLSQGTASSATIFAPGYQSRGTLRVEVTNAGTGTFVADRVSIRRVGETLPYQLLDVSDDPLGNDEYEIILPGVAVADDSSTSLVHEGVFYAGDPTAPIIESVVYDNPAVSYVVQATDADGDTLLFTYESSSPDLVVSPSGSTFTVTPLTSDGAAQVLVTAHDRANALGPQGRTHTYAVDVTWGDAVTLSGTKYEEVGGLGTRALFDGTAVDQGAFAPGSQSLYPSFGARGMATIGDIDGDGIEDVAVGAPTAQGWGELVLVTLQADGTVKSTTAIGVPPLVPSPPPGVDGLNLNDGFGFSVAGLGDLDGDGGMELVVGAPGTRDSFGITSGAVWIVSLDASGAFLSASRIDGDDLGLHSFANLGQSVAPLGDVDGNGTFEVAVGAPGISQVYILSLDSSGGFSLAAQMTSPFGGGFGQALAAPGDLDGDGVGDFAVGDGNRVVIGLLNADLSLKGYSDVFGGSGSPSFATTLASIGDVDGDGHVDLGVGDPASPGILTVLSLDGAGGVARATQLSVSGLPSASFFGGSLVSLGDRDGDGSQEWLVGYRSSSNDVRVLSVPAGLDFGGFRQTFTGDVLGGTQIDGSNLAGPGASDELGSAVAVLGDLDGDGVDDLAVGAPGTADVGHVEQGAVWVLRMNADGSVKASFEIDTGELGLADFERFGTSVEAIGDIDGDGVPDMAVGSLLAEGEVRLVRLNADGSVKSATAIGAGQGGFTDPLAVGDHFGSAIASIGDLDGDGVRDLVVGADAHDGTGAVWLLLMNADGTVKSSHGIENGIGGFDGALALGDRFGAALTAPGDVDGDGIPDLAVGAPSDPAFSADPGAAWLLFLNTDGSVREGRRITAGSGGLTLSASASFGAALAALGDVDGDGVPDLAVGAPDEDPVFGATSGMMYALLLHPDGGVKGFAPLGVTTSLGIQPGEHFGSAIASLGDADGDGTVRWLVGAPYPGTGGIVRSLELQQGEPGLEGFVIFEDANGDGILDPVTERFTVSDVNGSWTLADLAPGGDGALVEVPQGGWVATGAPDRQTVTAPVSGGLDFGNRRVLDAGRDLTATEGNLVTLSDGLFVDPDPGAGGTFLYHWDIVRNGQTVASTSPTALAPGAVPDFAFVVEDDGIHVATLTIENSARGTSYSDTRRIVVANAAPVVSLVPTALSGVEGDAIGFTGFFTDAGFPPGAVATETHTLVWRVFEVGGTPDPILVDDTSGFGFAFTLPDEGSFRVELLVTDDEGATGTGDVILTASNADPQVLLPDPGAVFEGEVVSFVAPFFDPGPADAGELTALWQVSSDNGQVIADFTGPDFSFVPVDQGPYTITLTVDDLDGGEGVDSLVLNVSNRAPVVTVPADFSVLEGDVVNVVGSFTDAGANDPATLLWQVFASNGQVVPDGTTAGFSFVPDDEGTYQLVFSVDDGTDVTQQSLFVTVGNAPPAPRIDPAASLEGVVEGALLDFSAFANDPGANDPLSYLWEVMRDGGPVIATGALADFAYTPGDQGAYTLRLTVGDGVDDVSTEIAFDVANVAPTVDLGPDFSLPEGTTIPSFQAILGSTFSDPGSEDTHTFQWSVVADNGQVVPPASANVFDLVPQDDGVYLVALRVTDDDGGIGADTLRLTVTNVAPSVTIDPAGPADENAIVTLSGRVTDVPSDPLTARIEFGDGGESPLLLAPDGSFAIQHVYADQGVFAVRVVALDDDGAEGQATLPLTINDVPVDPDINRDGNVDAFDLAALRALFYTRNAGADLNDDGFVNAGDLRVLLDALASAAQAGGQIAASTTIGIESSPEAVAGAADPILGSVSAVPGPLETVRASAPEASAVSAPETVAVSAPETVVVSAPETARSPAAEPAPLGAVFPTSDIRLGFSIAERLRLLSLQQRVLVESGRHREHGDGQHEHGQHEHGEREEHAHGSARADYQVRIVARDDGSAGTPAEGDVGRRPADERSEARRDRERVSDPGDPTGEMLPDDDAQPLEGAGWIRSLLHGLRLPSSPRP